RRREIPLAGRFRWCVGCTTSGFSLRLLHQETLDLIQQRSHRLVHLVVGLRAADLVEKLFPARQVVLPLIAVNAFGIEVDEHGSPRHRACVTVGTVTAHCRCCGNPSAATETHIACSRAVPTHYPAIKPEITDCPEASPFRSTPPTRDARNRVGCDFFIPNSPH